MHKRDDTILTQIDFLLGKEAKKQKRYEVKQFDKVAKVVQRKYNLMGFKSFCSTYKRGDENA